MVPLAYVPCDRSNLPDDRRSLFGDYVVAPNWIQTLADLGIYSVKTELRER